MNERTDERIDELIALAALGELSETEETELDTLLASDPELVSEVDEAMESAAMLQGAISEMPTASLRASIMEAIASTPQAPARRSWVDEPPASPSHNVDEPAGESAQVIDLSARRRRWVSALSAAAAMILLVGIGIVFTRDDSLSVDEQIAAETENVVDADDAVSRVLEGSLDGTLTVVYSPGEEALVIDGDGLPVLGEDRAFVLWFVSEDVSTPVQIFQPDASGDVLVRVDDVDPTDFVLGITEEDAAGAEKPTMPLIATA